VLAAPAPSLLLITHFHYVQAAIMYCDILDGICR
jgi:hypothetical protein